MLAGVFHTSSGGYLPGTHSRLHRCGYPCMPDSGSHYPSTSCWDRTSLCKRTGRWLPEECKIKSEVIHFQFCYLMNYWNRKENFHILQLLFIYLFLQCYLFKKLKPIDNWEPLHVEPFHDTCNHGELPGWHSPSWRNKSYQTPVSTTLLHFPAQREHWSTDLCRLLVMDPLKFFGWWQ